MKIKKSESRSSQLGVSLIVFFASLTSCAPSQSQTPTQSQTTTQNKTPTQSQTSTQSKTLTSVKNLTDTGVQLLATNNFKRAIEKFEQALKLDPAFKPAKDNLVIAYGKFGLQQCSKNPTSALKTFHKAMRLDPSNPTNVQNLDDVVKLLGKDPKDFEHRVQLGDEARDQFDFEGAVVEYEAALKIKPDSKTQEKLDACLHVKAPPFDNNQVYKPKVITAADIAREQARERQELKAQEELKGRIPKDGVKSNSNVDVDFKPYMKRLQTKMQDNWEAPDNSENKRVEVTFNITRSGELIAPMVTDPSGSSDVDAAALAAVRKCVPFEPLPEGSPFDVKIDFLFDYSVWRSLSKPREDSLKKKVALAAKPQEKIMAIMNLASAYTVGERFQQAYDQYKLVSAIIKKHFPKDYAKNAELYEAMGYMYRCNDKSTPALTAYGIARGFRENGLGKDHVSVAKNLEDTAKNVYVYNSQYGHAETLFKRALTIRRAKLKANDGTIIRNLCDLADCYKEQRNFTEAEKYYLEALTLAKGKSVCDYGDVAEPLAQLYVERGSYAKAEPLLKISIDHYELMHSGVEKHKVCLEKYEQVLNRLGKNDDAVAIHRKLEDVRKVLRN